ncbi:hypothetical protein EPN52_03720, partial [bacterium]
EEVQKIYGTLDIFEAQEHGVSLTDLRRISQIPLTKLKVILALLKKSGFIVNRARSTYALAPFAKKNPALVLNLANYETKKSYDQSKLVMMLQYCETQSCRRRFILNYFGEDYEAEFCGACDNCLARARSAAARSNGERSAESVEPASFRIGDAVLHAKYGSGTVERVDRDLVTVLFPSIGYKTLLASAVRKEAQIA